jgi:hypothetical protein
MDSVGALEQTWLLLTVTVPACVVAGSARAPNMVTHTGHAVRTANLLEFI